MLLSAGRVLTPARALAPGWIRVEGPRVVEIGQGPPPQPPDLVFPDETVVPGYVDAHAHGGGGASFGAGDADAATVVRAHLAHGTTTMMASLVTDTHERLERCVAELAALADDGLVAGVHLEGPWLSPLHKGAHDPDLLTEPDPRRIESLVAAGRGHLRMVTLAPELAGGLEAVRRLAGHGIVVAIGHTDATFQVASAALDGGATVGTHLFNAMRPLHHRDPGPIAALLEQPGVHVELIADGVHLHPAALRLAAAVKPRDFVLITDAMAAAAAEDGDYLLGRLAVQVRDGVARLADSGAIAGSTLTMAAAVKYAIRTAGLALVDAIRGATLNPATMLGLGDAVGALRPGLFADLLVLDGYLDVRRVMRRGTWV
jgi:N-acetylglucosamine-6-phosphate deacetylase